MKEPEDSRTDQQEREPAGETGPKEARLAWIRTYRQTGNVRLVCEKFEISKKTFYKWLKRYNEAGGEESSLEDRSRRPHSFPKSTPESVIFLLKQARDRTGFGQRRLRAYMEKNYNISISERTIWKILKKVENGSEERNSKGYF
ncbi:MAG: helix-turn-helix domain-containing protein [Ignavibacteria bacterium]|nr:helix-turn-helix domain-containing protein [Ignavibacteria bacterium]